MTPEHAALLARIEALAIDSPGAALRFGARLARENGWPRSHAERVVREYRRFLFLAATAPHAVTPSDAVDQAWHLHLAYTRSYWDDLCGGILGRPLHHCPTAGGKAEDARYRGQYAATLAAYAEAFGEAPPADIWPAADARFTGDFVRIDRSTHWATPKRAVAAAALVPAAGIGLVAAAGSSGWSLWPLLAPLLVAVIVGALAFAGREGRRRRGNDSGSSCGGGGDDSDGDSGCGNSSGCGGGGCGGGGD